MNDQTNRWVAVIYEDGEKAGSRLFTGEEDEVRVLAKEWAVSKRGDSVDWTLHHIVNTWK